MLVENWYQIGECASHAMWNELASCLPVSCRMCFHLFYVYMLLLYISHLPSCSKFETAHDMRRELKSCDYVREVTI